jgi:hypothetical protein
MTWILLIYCALVVFNYKLFKKAWLKQMDNVNYRGCRWTIGDRCFYIAFSLFGPIGTIIAILIILSAYGAEFFGREAKW